MWKTAKLDLPPAQLCDGCCRHGPSQLGTLESLIPLLFIPLTSTRLDSRTCYCRTQHEYLTPDENYEYFAPQLIRRLSLTWFSTPFPRELVPLRACLLSVHVVPARFVTTAWWQNVSDLMHCLHVLSLCTFWCIACTFCHHVWTVHSLHDFVIPSPALL